MEGVIRTRVGYAGGMMKNPSYYDMGDHTETIQIDYDPERITYQELIDVFWRSHRPVYPQYKRQYMSILFYHDADQQQIQLESRKNTTSKYGQRVYTEIVPFEGFYLAEDYHQKYYLQLSQDLMKDIRHHYSDFMQFVNATSTARINGYVAGKGTMASLQGEIEDLGLSDGGKRRLITIVEGYGR